MDPSIVRWPPRSTTVERTRFHPASSRLSLHSGSLATMAHPGTSFRLELRPVGPSLRFVSLHSAWVSCRAPESSLRWRRSVVRRHSCLRCMTESSRSCRKSSYVFPVLRSQARPSNNTASDGHRINHHREVSVRWRARCKSIAAARVGRSDFSMSFPSQFLRVHAVRRDDSRRVIVTPRVALIRVHTGRRAVLPLRVERR